MQINLYHRTYRAKGAPVALSLTPFPTHQRHTFTVGTVVHEAVYKELRVIVPDDATIDPLKRLLSWSGASGAVKSTAQEVYDMAAAGAPGFELGK